MVVMVVGVKGVGGRRLYERNDTIQRESEKEHTHSEKPRLFFGLLIRILAYIELFINERIG